MRVLIIEDNADSRALLAKLLQLYGCEVSTADDGLAGFDAINRLRPDVALVDIRLPGMDGYEIVRRVRSQLKDIPTRLIAVTGYGRSEDRATILAAGFDAHIAKPINPDDLMRIMATNNETPGRST
jgi:CheY-like chemotaxis protein